MIRFDRYVRIGNGNQLVRNPKRRTRVFANEKVRWSLHTARTRLAKKKKFCQFFTRFGKCNKDDGKCPYIHDSSKIAVCTKFLNGLCSNPDCKLTHKVIPERMQDCSYFLQGLCSNNHCPYRHVNVNSAASVCEGFLKGYCADGNEVACDGVDVIDISHFTCRKKHSYACPAFEATGKCSQGTKCKLHHPKNQLKRKHQSSMDQQQKNSRGRYFGSVRVEEAKGVSEKLYLKNDDMDDDVDLCQEGKFAEYISLDVGNEEAGEVTGEARTNLMMSEPSGLDADEFDELTKPIGIMNRVVLDSPSECDMGVS
ncbi:putative transcription factor C3H family [Helianthus debilis subsp. tardiflorus]